MSNIFQDQKDFMLAGDQVVNKSSMTQIALYEKLITEEYEELIIANSDWDSDSLEQQTEVIKEALDCIVVLSGFLISMGIDADKAWHLVHNNNMSKVNCGSDTILKDKNGKIMKSPESIARKAEMMKQLRGLCEQ